MAVSTHYSPRKLRSLLQELAPRFFLPEEFPMRQYDSLVSGLLAKADTLDVPELQVFAASVSSKDLETLLLYLPDASEKETAGILRILEHRANRRVAELFWSFYQYHFENTNVTAAAKTLLENLPDGDRSALPARNLDLFINGTSFEGLLLKIMNDIIPLSIFASREKLLLESPLALLFLTQYFSSCDKDGFLLNDKRLLTVFNKTTQNAAEVILTNYLQRLNREEYLLPVNLYIMERWGEPFMSPDWSGISKELRKKFADWNSYRRLAEHFKYNKLKLRILNEYVPYILHIRLVHDGQYLAADFGEVVIIDDNEATATSYLLKKNFYEEVSESLEKYSMEFIKTTKTELTNARDFIIEEAEDSIMQLEYDELGKLYIRDTMNIILRLSPDLRPSKSLMRKKRKKTGSRQESDYIKVDDIIAEKGG